MKKSQKKNQENKELPADDKKATGRKKGAKNVLTKESKQILWNVLKGEYERMDKCLVGCSFDERAIHLKHLAKFLAYGDDEIAKEFRAILWEQTKGHYKKMQFYFPHLSPKEKITALQGFLSYLAPHDRKQAVDDINNSGIK
jgi:hypothetical protein